MRKLITRLVIAFAAIFCVTSLSSCNYNSLVEQQQTVDQAWAQVENQYQRRADLIPNLVNTVKGYSTHESETLTKVTEARAKATSITINADDLNEENLAKFQQAQGELSQALKSLLAVTEAYPDLKANENFMNLQTELSEIEQKIVYARGFYNDSVLKLNNKIEMFPSNIIAKMFGFKKRTFFEAKTEERENVKVKF